MQKFGNRLTTLCDIRLELNSRYKDLRQPYTSPSNEEVFNLLTKETPLTFNVGMGFSYQELSFCEEKESYLHALTFN